MMLVTMPWVVVRVLLLFQFPPMKTFLIYVIDDILILNEGNKFGINPECDTIMGRNQ
jgi:hypothetical protein